MVRIGDLAMLGKVTPRTVRYYEGLGLIPPGEREAPASIVTPNRLLHAFKRSIS